MTAIIVTIIAYSHGPPADIEQRIPAFSTPHGPLNNAIIASFHANAATRPNAAVINADNFSLISFFIILVRILNI